MSTPRVLTSQERWHIIWSNAFMPIGVLALAWLMYLVEALFDFDLGRLIRRHRWVSDRNPDEDPPYFWIAVVATPIALAVAAYYIRRALRLAQHGVEVAAKVTRLGRLSTHGLVRLYYEYTVDGQQISKVMSCEQSLANSYLEGTRPLILVCDPAKPRRAMERSKVWPDAEQSS